MAGIISADGNQKAGYSILSRAYYAASVTTFQAIVNPLVWVRDLYQWVYPPPSSPSIVKSYDCRPHLPINIFFPREYDQTSPQTLATFFSVHGGGWIIGTPSDMDEWNSRFASDNNMLVIALNYSKAPYSPFPHPIRDVEALSLAVFNDESLPIDKSCVIFGGTSAGANLGLAACQLQSIRDKLKPRAFLSLHGMVDQSISYEERLATRYYKPTLSEGTRSRKTDYLAPMYRTMTWSYISHGQDLQDPLLSPTYARREHLPPHLFFIAAELDMLGHENWRMACRMAGRSEPPLSERVGQEMTAKGKGELILDDERFSFSYADPNGKTSVRWLLVPDEIHGFDGLPPHMLGGEESVQDAQVKTTLFLQLVSEWLKKVVIR